MAFGANRETGVATTALLVETSLALRDRDTWFGRFEWAEKSADDLGIHFIAAIYDVAKLQLGYTAYFPAVAPADAPASGAACRWGSCRQRWRPFTDTARIRASRCS